MPTAFVFMSTVPALMPEVLEEIRAVDGVEDAEMLYGVFDIVVKVKTETLDELKHVITYKIRAIANVLTTNTQLVVRQK